MIGKIILHYKILEKLGEGGMGVVYKAEDTKLKRTVALKFLSSQSLASKEEKARFEHEAQAAAALDHPNICTVYEINEADRNTFIAMAYVQGQSLQKMIGPVGATDRPLLRISDALNYAIQIAEGLQAAHEREIVHRDIKPGNILITEKGHIKITDFGLAKLAGRTQLTKVGTSMGTVAYMSPEQGQGSYVDHRTDIWALGAVMYEMVTGKRPFVGDFEQSVIYSIMNEDPEPPTALRTGVPMELERIVLKALAKEANERFQNVQDMLVDLKNLQKTLERGAEKSSATITMARPGKKATRAKRSSFVHGTQEHYISDVFISYGHLDNKTFTKDQRGWIDHFHKTLQIRLQELMGKKLSVWQDKSDIRGDEDFKQEIIEGIRNVAIFVAIISPSYLKSDWCTQELAEFLRVAKESNKLQIGNKLRIYKVIKTPVPREEIPEVLKKVTGYEFFKKDDVTEKLVEFRRQLGLEFGELFIAKVFDVAYDMHKLLTVIHKEADSSTDAKIPTPEADSPAGATIPSNGKYVYLAETTSDLTDQYDSIRRELEAQGYTALPDRQLPHVADELRDSVKNHLKRCLLSVHLMGNKYGSIPEGEEVRSVVWLQNDLAAEYSKTAGLSRIIWMPRNGPTTPEDRQAKYLENLQKESFQAGGELLKTSIEDLKSVILNKLVSVEQPETETPVRKSESPYIYLICDERDLEMIKFLYDFLHDNGLEVLTSEFEGDADAAAIRESHKKNLVMCDAALIYYGHASEAWVRLKLQDLSKALGFGRKNPIPHTMIYVGLPKSPKKSLFKSRVLPYVTNFDESVPDALWDFLAKIKDVKGSS